METVIVVLLVAAALFFAARNLRKEVKGEGCDCSKSGSCGEKQGGGCCSGRN